VGGTAYVDTSTTDVVSVLQLGDPPLPGRATPRPSAKPRPSRLRTPLQQLAYIRWRRAQGWKRRRAIDSMMKNPTSRWVDAQDPSRGARHGSLTRSRVTRNGPCLHSTGPSPCRRGHRRRQQGRLRADTHRAGGAAATIDAVMPAGASERPTGYVVQQRPLRRRSRPAVGQVMVGDPCRATAC